MKTILLAADLEPESRPAIDYAFELAEKLGAVVHAMHAYTMVPPPSPRDPRSVHHEALRQRAAEKLRSVTAAHRASPSIGKHVVELGEPVAAITKLASALRADLIIVGTHARKGMRRMILGSIAEGVMREATIPVLVIRTPVLVQARSA